MESPLPAGWSSGRWRKQKSSFPESIRSRTELDRPRRQEQKKQQAKKKNEAKIRLKLQHLRKERLNGFNDRGLLMMRRFGRFQVEMGNDLMSAMAIAAVMMVVDVRMNLEELRE